MVGGSLTVYIAGSTTPTNTWQDSALTVANTNPITLDARGECVLWLDPAIVYKFVLKNILGVIQWTQDNINSQAPLRSDLATATGAAQIGANAYQTQDDVNLERVSVKRFGAKGDGVTDDTAAISLALSSVPEGTVLHFPRGVYRLTNGITIPPGVIVTGDGAPVMGTFPTQQDDKRYLRPGYKHLIPGSTLLFSGTGAETATTVRSAPFASFTYAVQVIGDNSPGQMMGIGVVMDMDVLDAGGTVTSAEGDNRSVYDVGVFVRDSANGKFNFTCFGYWRVAGVINYGNDPDQNTFYNGSSSGERGFVHLATGYAGHSGNTSTNWNYYSNDHHSRNLTSAQWGTCALSYDSTNGYICNGLYAHGGRIHTYCDTPLLLNDVSNVWFFGTVMETPDLASPGATTSRFIGNATVDKVGFIGCRFTDNPIYGVDKLSGLINGQIIFVGTPTNFTPAGSIEVLRGGKAARLTMRTEGPSIHLTNDLTSSSAGLLLQLDESGDAALKFAGVTKATLYADGRFQPEVIAGKKARWERTAVVMSAASISATRSYHTVTSGTGAAFDLTTINGGTLGDTLYLQAGAYSEPMTLKITGGNIRGAADKLVTGFTRALLMFDGSFWVIY